MHMLLTRAKVSLNNILPTLLFVVILIYFSYHAVSGDRGLLALIQLSHKIESARAELDVIHSTRLKLERNVKLMRSDSLDLDLLDEQARRLLGYADKDEKIYNLN
jgi:cell division protein FtsB